MSWKKRIVLAAHCLLNPFTRVHFTGRNFPLSGKLFSHLFSQGIGVLQMPCPETEANGLSRLPMGRMQYDNAFYRRHCADIMGRQLQMIEEFRRKNYKIVCFLGVQGSPCCGLDWGNHRLDRRGFETGNEQEVGLSCDVLSRGINAEVLEQELKKLGLAVPFLEVPIRAVRDSPEIDKFFIDLDRLIGKR
jgi:predicted secreted protein